ncbi:hypothetical protein ACH5RR_029850 [Cinchona calisaya]|uniref:Uncharacterized protein n=1 Tax=Cinchona calisaya TaxID=153742 RepID=A0ABD2YSV8_9GENT
MMENQLQISLESKESNQDNSINPKDQALEDYPSLALMPNPNSTTMDVNATLDRVEFPGKNIVSGPIIDDNVILSHDEEAKGTNNITATVIDKPQLAQHANVCMAQQVEGFQAFSNEIGSKLDQNEGSSLWLSVKEQERKRPMESILHCHQECSFCTTG